MKVKRLIVLCLGLAVIFSGCATVDILPKLSDEQRSAYDAMTAQAISINAMPLLTKEDVFKKRLAQMEFSKNHMALFKQIKALEPKIGEAAPDNAQVENTLRESRYLKTTRKTVQLKMCESACKSDPVERFAMLSDLYTSPTTLIKKSKRYMRGDRPKYLNSRVNRNEIVKCYKNTLCSSANCNFDSRYTEVLTTDGRRGFILWEDLTSELPNDNASMGDTERLQQ